MINSMINYFSGKPDYTVVFVGVVGGGKSAAGNFFLNGEHFPHGRSLGYVTTQCSAATSTICGKTVKIIDTPGLFCLLFNDDKTFQELNKSLALAKDGIHAIAIVMSLDYRCTELHVKAIMRLLHLKSRLFVLWTHARHFGVTKAEADEIVQCSEISDDFKNILPLIENRVIMVESFNTTEEYRVQKSEEFMAMIKHIHQSNGYKVYNDVLILEKDSEERSKGKIILCF